MGLMTMAVEFFIGWICNLSWFTKIPAVLLMSAILPFINPGFWIPFTIIILSIHFTKNDMSTNPDGSKDFSRTFGYSYLISLTFTFICVLIGLFTGCKINEVAQYAALIPGPV